MTDNIIIFSSSYSPPSISFIMMKLILAMTLLVTISMASPADDGTDVHNTLIADYCAADDAGRDAILVQLEGWCLPTSKMVSYFQDLSQVIIICKIGNLML